MIRRVGNIYGLTVRATDGDVGRVYDLYFDDQTWEVKYIVVEAGGWLLNRHVLISSCVIEKPVWEDHVLPVTLTRDQIEESPDIDLHKPVSKQQLTDLHEHYVWPIFWNSSIYPGSSSFPTMLIDTDWLGSDYVKGKGDENQDPHLRSVRDIIGYQLEAQDGDIGHVADFFITEKDWVIRYMLADTRRWLLGRKVLIALRWIEKANWPLYKVHVNLTKQQIIDSPVYDPNVPISREQESELCKHYNCPGYWEEES